MATGLRPGRRGNRVRSQETGRRRMPGSAPAGRAAASGTVGPLKEISMRALLALTFAFVSTSALAHGGHAEPAGLVHGFLHPLGGLDHILAMVAVGVFAFVLGGRALWLVPFTFVLTMAIGFGLGLAGLHLPFVELMIAASSIV